MNVIFLPDVAKVALKAEGINLDTYDFLEVIRDMFDYSLLECVSSESKKMLNSPSFLFYGSNVVTVPDVLQSVCTNNNNMNSEDAASSINYRYLEVHGTPELLIYSRGNGPVAPTHLSTFMKMNDHASASEVISSTVFQEWLRRIYPLRKQ